MKKLKLNVPVIFVALLLAGAIIAQSLLSGCSVKSADTAQTAATPDTASFDEAVTVAAAVAATTAATTEPATVTTQPANPEPAAEPKAESKTTEKPTEATTEPETQATVQWATVMTEPEKTPYEEQWAQGYIVAIDYPDKTYQTFHIELTEEDRDILEHLCMGEFGSGGFIGAALIAQCVKDAMCFDGYKTVEDVRVQCKYDASLDNTPTEEVKQAVSYIFDYDNAAVQHRMMYMYNPYLVISAFHESQNYILTYGPVRFFDRWGY